MICININSNKIRARRMACPDQLCPSQMICLCLWICRAFGQDRIPLSTVFSLRMIKCIGNIDFHTGGMTGFIGKLNANSCFPACDSFRSDKRADQAVHDFPGQADRRD